MYGNMLRNSDYQRNLRGYSFLYGTSCLVSSHIYGGRVRLQLFFSLHVMVRASFCTLLLLQLVSHTARIDGSTGSPRCSPSFPGVTPPTMLVPHSRDCFAFWVACGRMLVHLTLVQINTNLNSQHVPVFLRVRCFRFSLRSPRRRYRQ